MNDSGYDVSNKEMVDSLEEWAERLVDRDLMDRFEYVPDTVLITACLQLAARKIAHRRDLLTPQTAHKILQRYLDEVTVEGPKN